jgi:hypothetical protein
VVDGRHIQQALNFWHRHGAPVSLRCGGEASEGVQWISRQILVRDTPVTESRQGFHIVRHCFTAAALAEALDRGFNLGEHVRQISKHCQARASAATRGDGAAGFADV